MDLARLSVVLLEGLNATNLILRCFTQVSQVKSNMASNKGNCTVAVGTRSQQQGAIQKTGTKVPAARKKEGKGFFFIVGAVAGETVLSCIL